MSVPLVIVVAVAAAVPLLLGLPPTLRLPGALLEILAGVALGQSALNWVTGPARSAWRCGCSTRPSPPR